MANLFTYGSLMFKEVIYQLTTKQDYESKKAVLKGYARRTVKENVYPGIYKAEGEQVQGVVYLAVTPVDLEHLHKFENTEYVPTEVEVQTEDGEIKAVAYVYANPDNLSESAWDAEEFEQKHKEEFAK